METFNFLPPIDIPADDFHRLAFLGEAASRRFPGVTRFLVSEIGRANLRDEWDRMGFVTMDSMVHFRDNLTRETRSIRLVYPKESSRRPGNLSILTWIGAGLIGVHEGHSIVWRDDRGRVRSITVLGVD